MPPPKFTEREIVWRCLWTLREIFQSRGKSTDDFDFIGDGPSEMQLEPGDLLKTVSGIYDDVYILFETSNGKSVVSDLSRILDDEPGIQEAILVIFSTEFVVQKMKKLTTLTPQANSALRLLATQRKVQVFFAIDLMTNVMQSRLQPRFRVLSDKEAKEVVSAYAATPPPIFSTDPVVKFLGLLPGTMIEVETPSTAFVGTSTFSYSLVVDESEVVEENEE